MLFRSWLFTGFDWYPEPGSYNTVATLAPEFKHGATLGTGDDEMCGILLKPSAISSIGLMDENFYPGYFEDNDYRYRQRLSGTFLEYCPLPSKHLTSSTLKSSPIFQRKNHMTFQRNLDYRLRSFLLNLVTQNVSFFKKDFSQALFHIGSRHLHDQMLCLDGIAQTGQIVSNRINYHIYALYTPVKKGVQK